MTSYTEIEGDNQYTAIQSNITKILELVNDPRGRKNKSNFLYQADPRRKSASFGSYPIIYIENYELIDEGNTNIGGNIFNKTLEFEFHTVIEDDSAKQKQWMDQLDSDLTYKFEYDKRTELAQQGIGQPTIQSGQRFTGIDRDEQPIIRREFTVSAPVQIDMEQVGGNDPYA